MRFDDFTARPALKANLKRAFASGRVSHAYLFAGPAGTGKKTMADICVRALYCTASEGERPCGVCDECRRFNEFQAHSDVYYLDVDEDRTQIRVENVKKIVFALSDKSISGGKRCVICREAEKMNTDAQDALLKTLEEPPEDTVFILCTESEARLLPTIVSRCVPVRFAPVSDAIIKEEILSGKVLDTEYAWICEAANGLPGMAVTLAQDGTAYKEMYASVKEAVRLAVRDKRVSEAAAGLKSTKNDAPQMLGCFETIGRKMLREDHAAGLRLLDGVFEARRMLKSNVTWQYVLDTLLIKAAEG